MQSTRQKIWNDRAFAEAWKWKEQTVLRHRALVSYDWTYRIGEFTQDFMPFAESRDRAMTAEEIREFKATRLTH